MAEICLVLSEPTLEENLAVLERNRPFVDLAELRADKLNADQYDSLSSFPDRAGIPVILSSRGEMQSRWLDGDFRFIEVDSNSEETDAVKKAREKGITVIKSLYCPNGVPSDLLEQMLLDKEDMVKAVVHPRSSEEFYYLVSAALELQNRRNAPFIICGTGEFGLPTSVLAEKLGSAFAYTYDNILEPGRCSAPDLHKVYRFRKISAKTSVFAIIGNPVAQSRSPHIHNGRYEEDGRDAVYVPFLTDSPTWFLKTADLLGIRGCSVTVPFKSEIIPLVAEKDDSVKKIGASNTIYRRDGGSWNATNTDAWGLVKPLLDLLGTNTLSGKKAAVIGAGGAARAAVFALTYKGAEVAVFNRTLSKAEELAGQFGCAAFPLEFRSVSALREYGSIIVQTSSAGMPPLEEVNPLDFFQFSGNEVVYDIIYKPAETKLMAAARKAGCTVLGGYKMLEEQADLQYRLFL